MARVDPYPIRQGQKALTPKQRRDLAAQEASAGFVNAMGGEGGAGWSRTPPIDADATKSAERIKSNRFGTLAKNLGKGAQQALTQKTGGQELIERVVPAVHEGMKRVGKKIAGGVEDVIEFSRNMKAINESRRLLGKKPLTGPQIKTQTEELKMRGKQDPPPTQGRAGRAVRQALTQKPVPIRLLEKFTGKRIAGQNDNPNRRKNDNWGKNGLPPVVNNKNRNRNKNNKPRY